MSVFSQVEWDHLLSAANSVYTYENFVKAVAAFPAVCGEKGTKGQAASLTPE